MTIINDYVEVFKKHKIIDAPRPYFRSSMLLLISALAGRTFKFRYGPLMSLGIREDDKLSGGLPLNLWFTNIGATRSARKTTVYIKAKDFIETIDGDMLTSSSFTPESLIKDLDEKCEDAETDAIWMDEECGTFFKGLNKKDYMATANDLLSTLYSGESYTRSTITRGDEVVLNPYITAWLASTDDLPRLFNEFQLRQGFLNRFIYVLGRRTEWFSPRASPEKIEAVNEDMKQKIKPWLRQLYTVSETRRYVSINYSDTAWELYDEYAMDVDNASRDEDMGIYAGWYGQMPNHIIKLSGLHRLARMSIDDLKDIGMLMKATKEDYEWAKEYMDKRWSDFKSVVELMKTTSRSSTPRTDKRELEMVFGAIKRLVQRSDDGWTQHSKVQRTTGLKKETLKEDINSLIDANKIRRKKYGEHSQGHPGVKYTIIQEDEGATTDSLFL